MESLNQEIMEFINLKVNKYVAEKTSFTGMQFDETLMFDNDNNQRLMTEHPLSLCANKINKYRQCNDENWKQNLLLNTLEDYFIKNYNIKFYIGYNTLFNLSIPTYGGNDTKEYLLYTNTNLYIILRYRVSYGTSYRDASIYSYSVGKEDICILNLSNCRIGQNNYGSEWYINYKNNSYLISSTSDDTIKQIINANLIRVIHPHVYADYLYLINPRNTYNILNNSKLTIKNLRIEIDELKQNKIESKKIDEAENTISTLNIKNSELINENNKMQKEVVSLTSQVYKTIELNETNKKTIDELTNKNNELESIIIKLKRENEQMSQLLSVN